MMDITSAKYFKALGMVSHIEAVIDGKTMNVPVDTGNRHYAAILEWAQEAANEIQAAE